MKVEQFDTHYRITVGELVFMQRKGRTVDNQAPLSSYEQVIVAACRDYLKSQRDPMRYYFSKIKKYMREEKGLCIHGLFAMAHPIEDDHANATPAKVIPFPTKDKSE